MVVTFFCHPHMDMTTLDRQPHTVTVKHLALISLVMVLIIGFLMIINPAYLVAKVNDQVRQANIRAIHSALTQCFIEAHGDYHNCTGGEYTHGAQASLDRINLPLNADIGRDAEYSDAALQNAAIDICPMVRQGLITIVQKDPIVLSSEKEKNTSYDPSKEATYKQNADSYCASYKNQLETPHAAAAFLTGYKITYNTSGLIVHADRQIDTDGKLLAVPVSAGEIGDQRYP